MQSIINDLKSIEETKLDNYVIDTALTLLVQDYELNVKSDNHLNAANETLKVNALLQITTASLPNGTVGTSYDQTLMASGGADAVANPYTWAVMGSLPAGLHLNQTTGEITGTPTSADTSSFKVTVKDADGAMATATLSLAVSEGETPTVTISPSVLPPLTECESYAVPFTATTNVAASSWAGFAIYASDAAGNPLPPSESPINAAQLLGFRTFTSSPTQMTSTLVNFNTVAPIVLSPSVYLVKISVDPWIGNNIDPVSQLYSLTVLPQPSNLDDNCNPIPSGGGSS